MGNITKTIDFYLQNIFEFNVTPVAEKPSGGSPLYQSVSHFRNIYSQFHLQIFKVLNMCLRIVLSNSQQKFNNRHFFIRHAESMAGFFFSIKNHR